MISVIIVEDEKLSAERLEQLLERLDLRIKVKKRLASVAETIGYFNSEDNKPDLIFMDIQLSDGNCFEVFDNVTIDLPIIFTTAYDEYAIKAFRVNSIDYLVKPIDISELARALDKFVRLRNSNSAQPDYSCFMLNENHEYKKRFMVKTGNALSSVSVDKVAYFYSRDGLVRLVTKMGQQYYLDMALDNIELRLNPDQFFRMNRKMIVGIDIIVKIEKYYNKRLKLRLNPGYDEEVIVARDRVAGFKKWLDR